MLLLLLQLAGSGDGFDSSQFFGILDNARN